MGLTVMLKMRKVVTLRMCDGRARGILKLRGYNTMQITKRCFLIAILGLALVQSSMAQGVMEFMEKTYSFEQIREDGGSVTHSFTFKNTGNAPVVIKQVSSSCGCTVSDWSKEPVLPGKEGFVAGTFNPMGRPGNFSKSLTVVSNAEPEREVLYLTGNVIPRARSKQEQYPYHMGQIWASVSFLSLPRVLHDGTTEGTLGLYNGGSKAEEVKFVMVPKSVMLSEKQLTLEPGEERLLRVVVDGSKVQQWGYTTEKFVCEVQNEKYPVELGFNRDENFAGWSEQERSNAPVATVETKEIDFGPVRHGDVLRGSFEMRNDGKGVLCIRRVQSNCSCVAVEVGKEKLKPNARTKVSVAFNTEGYRGEQIKDISLITNDPQQRYVRLRVRADVR